VEAQEQVAHREPKPEAVGYVRVSKEERGRRGYSIEDQTDRIKQYAHAAGWHLPEENIFIDDGFSGGFLERPGLDALRDKVEEGGVSFAIAAYWDRWARSENPSDMFVLTYTLREKGCKIQSLDFSGDLDTAEGQLQADMLGAFARFQRTKIKELTRRGKRRRAMDGRIVATTFVDYGFTLSESRDAYVINEETIPILKQIFEMVSKKGMGLHSVANRLMEQKVPAPEGGMLWHPKVLRGMINKDVYLARPYDEVASLVLPKVAARLNSEKRYGIWWYGKMRHWMVGQKKIKTSDVDCELWVAVPVPDCGIDPELVIQARQAIEDHRGAYIRNGSPRTWELSGGLVLCAHCSNRMGTNTGRNGVRYYRCNRRARFGERACIGAKTMKADYLEAEVWRRVTTFMTHPELFQESLRRATEARFKTVSTNPDRELGALMKRMSTLERKRIKIEDLVIAEIMTQDRARFRLKEVEEEIESIRARMEALKSARQKAELFEQKAREIQGWSVFQARQELDLLSSEKRRALYASLDIAVFVDQKGKISVRYPLGTLEDPSSVKAAHG
jgi:site-specific DNA recombinase